MNKFTVYNVVLQPLKFQIYSGDATLFSLNNKVVITSVAQVK